VSPRACLVVGKATLLRAVWLTPFLVASLLSFSFLSLAYPIHDELFAMDCQTTIANDMSFFPFSEPLTSVVLAFSRDTWVSTMSKAQAHTPLEHVGGDGNTMNVPASGGEKGFRV